ncbi:hypothetical protein [Ancylobacter sp. IITR112]|uniref:hypothetical protein n=1 Tax=Ancylobacter sp. IITR112 TaxID=3138073 RepID=UPI00352ABD32
MPHLVRFLLRHALIGVGLGALFVGTLVLLDVGRLGTLVGQSASGVIALVILTFAVGITFGSVQMGFAIMLMGEDEEKAGPGGKRRRAPTLTPTPVRVPARTKMPGAERRGLRGA